MFGGFNYFPTLFVRPSEIEGLGRLPDHDKDSILPSIRLRKWHNSGSLDNSFNALEQSFGARPAILDLGPIPGQIKTPADAALIELHNSAGGHAAWVHLLEGKNHLIPTLQWGGTAQQTSDQAANLVDLGRGLVLRLRRANQWDLSLLSSISSIDSGDLSVLVVLEYSQLAVSTDLTAAAAELSGVASAVLAALPNSDVTFTLAVTSFPPEFASIDREHARIPIRERGLFSILSAGPPFAASQTQLVYGDLASVCADRGPIARGGAPRIDLAARNEWAYYRREVDLCYVSAAQAVMADAAWQDDLAIWGTNEIRRAASGDLTNLEYQRRWVAVRINLHLHQQINYDAPHALIATDDPWSDD